jgi:hypothetical protein
MKKSNSIENGKNDQNNSRKGVGRRMPERESAGGMLAPWIDIVVILLCLQPASP